MLALFSSVSGIALRAGDKSAIQIFDKEFEEYQGFAGRIIVGDMNVHTETWL